VGLQATVFPLHQLATSRENLVPLTRFELATHGFEDRRSCPLSYKGLVGLDGFEPSIVTLRGYCSTVKLQTHELCPKAKIIVGLPGLEPGLLRLKGGYFNH
jgi:hypothetical protein